MSTLLVVENDEDTALALRILLNQAGYRVEHTDDGRAALRAAQAVQPDLLVFDLGVSNVDRDQVLAAIRALRDVPVLLLAPPGQDADEVRLLRQEAAGYLAKPFDNADLVARVEELLRRPRPPARSAPAGASPFDPLARSASAGALPFDPPVRRAPAAPAPFDPAVAARAALVGANGGEVEPVSPGAAGGVAGEEVYDDGYLRLDAHARSARVQGQEIRLTPIEFRLLEVLIRHHDVVLSPSQLLARAWGDPSGVGPDRVKFAVLRLRRKLGAREPEDSPVESVRGFGYRYRQPH